MVGFGISIGDCIALVQILYQSIEAFNETRGAVTHYQGVIQSLKNIECALAPLHNREIREPTLKAAIEKVTNQCSKAIHAFIISNGKYSSLTQNDGTRRRIENGLRKIQWALYKKSQVEELQDQLGIYLDTLQILLILLHEYEDLLPVRSTLSAYTQ